MRIGLPLDGWALAVVDGAGEPVAMGESGELVIGGVGLARYLDAEQGRREVRPAAVAGLGARLPQRRRRPRRRGRAAVPRARRRAGQARRAAHRAGRGRRRAAGAARRARRGGRRAPHPRRATRCWSATWCPRSEPGHRRRGARPARAAARRARAAARGRRRPADAHVGQGRPGRAALAAPPASSLDPVAAGLLTPTEGWLAEGWAEILGVPVTDPKADFFTHGGGSLTAAQLVARIRTRHPQVSVNDIYLHPTLGALATRLDALSATRTARARRRADAAPRRARAGPAHGPDAGAGRPALGERRRGDLDGRRRRRSLGARPCRGGRSPWPGWCCSARPGGSGSPRAAPGCCCAACGPAATRAAARCTCGCGRPTGSPSCPARRASRARRGPPATPARSARRSATTSTCTPRRP